MNKTIARSEGIIFKRIECLGKKIDNVQERWPENMYGLRWMEKTDKYEKEIQELREYLEERSVVQASLERARDHRKETFRSRMLLKDIANKLEDYGETSLADRLRRELHCIDEL